MTAPRPDRPSCFPFPCILRNVQRQHNLENNSELTRPVQSIISDTEALAPLMSHRFAKGEFQSSLASYLSSLDLLRCRVYHCRQIQPWGTDGASSLFESTHAREPVQLQSPSHVPSGLPIDEADKHPITTNGLSEAYGRFWQDVNTMENLSKPNPLPRARLPWLDGSRSRQGSMPFVPGAFIVERSGSIKQKPPVLNASALSGSTESSTRNRPASKSAHTGPLFGSTNDPMSEGLQQLPEAGTTVVDQNDKLPRQLPAPIITTARDLYQTDSSACSDSEASMRSGRKQALSISSEPREILSSFDGGQTETTLLAPDEQQSPKTAIDPKDSSNRPPAGFSSSPVLSDPRVSMTVQPIRLDKTAINTEDLPASHKERQRSISVQPIKSYLTSDDRAEAKHQHGEKTRPVTLTHKAADPLEDIQNSIYGLENLMQEAMQIARHAAEYNRSEEVPGILGEARDVLHRSAWILDEHKTVSDPKTSPDDDACSSDTCCSSCSSLSDSETDASPGLTMNTQTKRPDADTAGKLDNVTLKKSRNGSGAPQTIWDEEWPHHRLASSQPIAIDWAYSHPSTSSRAPLQNSESKLRFARHSDPNLSSISRRRQSHLVEESPKAVTQATPSVQSRNKPVNVARTASNRLPGRNELGEHVQKHGEPLILPRSSSLKPPRVGFEGTSSPQPPHNGETDNRTSPPAREREQLPSHASASENWGRDKFDERDYVKTNDILRGKHHVTLRDGEHFSIHHGHRRQPIARNWSTPRKRVTAVLACLNTALVGMLIGIYAGEVPAIQYTLADTRHMVILGNVFLYIGMAVTTFLFWPLPLLHGRKPYTLFALGMALPLQIPPAIIVRGQGTIIQNYSGSMTGLLVSRGLLGLVLGFAHINFKSTLLDLYGSSLQSEYPHGEFVIVDDVRRHGGGMGYWLGIWSFSFIGSLALGFLVGADIISGMKVSWGFYISVILVAIMLFLNVIAPETRRSPHRRTMQEVELPNESISRRVARGEIKMHVSGDGPKWWWEEVFAGIYLSFRMLLQPGFFVMALYLAWIYAQVVLIIVVSGVFGYTICLLWSPTYVVDQLLGNLLSAEYTWRPEYVGLGVFAVAIGALLAVPTAKANFFSQARVKGPRTDSMTIQSGFRWSSHMIRRTLFMTALPVAGLAYTLASKGNEVSYMAPIIFAAMIGYISNLAIAECNGIIMETFDTSDLQPGTNSRHRLQSLAPSTKRKRTTYSSYPRVSAGFYVSQSLGFLFAAGATGVGGAVTRTVGAQKATAITAGILMGLTLLLTCALVRFRTIQVIPDELFGSFYTSSAADKKKSTTSIDSAKSWRAVVIGNPSGKLRRMSWMEMGNLSRWTEIRRLNRLLSRTNTQTLNPGWQ